MTKEELKNYRGILLEIEQLELEIERLETQLKYPAGKGLSDMPASVSSNPDKIGETIAKVCEIRELLYHKKVELLDTRISIEKAIEKLDTEDRVLFRHRYIEGMKWEKICSEMNYSWNSIHQRHRNGLIKLKGKKK